MTNEEANKATEKVCETESEPGPEPDHKPEPASLSGSRRQDGRPGAETRGAALEAHRRSADDPRGQQNDREESDQGKQGPIFQTY